jgi:lactate dehydrogenase-like 2-hydroxyacid dehydrogenase
MSGRAAVKTEAGKGGSTQSARIALPARQRSDSERARRPYTSELTPGFVTTCTELADVLAALDNVVQLSHMGSATIEGRTAMGERVIINIKTFADGHGTPDRVIGPML